MQFHTLLRIIQKVGVFVLRKMKKENLSRAVEKKDRALTYEREVNRRVLESMQSGVCVVGNDLKVIYFSKRLGEMLDLDHQSAVGKTVQEIFNSIGGLDIPGMAAVYPTRGLTSATWHSQFSAR